MIFYYLSLLYYHTTLRPYGTCQLYPKTVPITDLEEFFVFLIYVSNLAIEAQFLNLDPHTIHRIELYAGFNHDIIWTDSDNMMSLKDKNKDMLHIYDTYNKFDTIYVIVAIEDKHTLSES